MRASPPASLTLTVFASGLLCASIAAAQETGSGLHWQEAPTLNVGTVFHGTIHAQGQVIGHDFAPLLASENTPPLELHRARVGLEGTLTTKVSFQIERELRDTDAAWRDAYVNVRSSRWLQVRFGQFKMPFSLDQLTSTQDRSFVYRSLAATYLAPGRDVGAMVHGRSGARIAYSLGVFRRGGENVRASERTAPQSDRTFAGRVVATPFGRQRQGLGAWSFGASATSSDLPEGLNSVRGKTFGDRSVLPAMAVHGARRRYGLESSWTPGPFIVRAESMAVVDERRHQGLDNSTLSPVTVRGFYASAVWHLPHQAAATAPLAFAVRWEALGLSGDRSSGASRNPRAVIPPDTRLRALTVGGTWTPTPFTRLQLNLVREASTSALIPEAIVAWSPVVAWQLGF